MKCEHCQQEHASDLRFCPHTGKLLSPERYLPEGSMLDEKYCIGPLLGAGGMSAVFEATHLLLQKKVAIKLLLPEFSHNEEMVARLVREARAASATGHHNVAAVTDMGRTRDGTVYLVMEHLGYRSLEEVIEEEAPMSPVRAASIMCEVLSGLEAVHKKGIIHRDLKPNNIMVAVDEEGTEAIKIVDFGISKITQEESSVELTTIGKVMGTPTYMAPEQAKGSLDLDHRTDLYACGAILYTMLTGSPPVMAHNYNALIVRILEGNIPPPSTKIMSLPSAMDRIVEQAMALRPEHRFPDAATFHRALEPFCRNVPQPIPQPITQSPPVLEIQHHMAIAAEEDCVPAPHKQSAVMPAAPLKSDNNALELAPLGAYLGDMNPSESTLSVDDNLFAPPIEQEEMELKLIAPNQVPPRSSRGQVVSKLELAADPYRRVSNPPSKGTLYNGPHHHPWGRLIKRTVSLTLLGVAALLIWQYRDKIPELISEQRQQDSVEITLETQPQAADVYVDGVLAASRSFTLPRSDNTYSIRVQAPGYHSQIMEIRPVRSQFLQVKLRPVHKE